MAISYSLMLCFRELGLGWERPLAGFLLRNCGGGEAGWKPAVQWFSG